MSYEAILIYQPEWITSRNCSDPRTTIL